MFEYFLNLGETQPFKMELKIPPVIKEKNKSSRKLIQKLYKKQKGNI